MVEVSPRLNISRYIFKGLSLDLGFAKDVIGDAQAYTTFDGAFRFDFGRSNHNVVPYILIGASSLKGKVITGTMNLGVGNTFWVFTKIRIEFSINLQVFERHYSISKISFIPISWVSI